jgi:hypothetical protein
MRDVIGQFTPLLYILLGFVPFAICILLAWKQRGPRRPDGMNLG